MKRNKVTNKIPCKYTSFKDLKDFLKKEKGKRLVSENQGINNSIETHSPRIPENKIILFYNELCSLWWSQEVLQM